MKCHLRRAATALFVATLGMSTLAHADSVTANFTTLVPGLEGTDPAPIATFTLNPDGTIAASMSATSSNGLYVFLYNGPQYYAFTNLSGGVTNALNPYTPVGTFTGGWVVTNGNDRLPTVTGTIGTPGSFTSVVQLFSPNSQGFELLAGTGSFTDWAGTISAPSGSPISPSSPVPIPAAFWLFGSGLLGLIGMARRKAA